MKNNVRFEYVPQKNVFWFSFSSIRWFHFIHKTLAAWQCDFQWGEGGGEQRKENFSLKKWSIMVGRQRKFWFLLEALKTAHRRFKIDTIIKILVWDCFNFLKNTQTN